MGIDFTTRVNSILVNAQACKVEHAYPKGTNKGIKFVNVSAGKNKANADFFIPKTDEKYKVDNCVIRMDDKKHLILNNSKTSFGLR